MAEAAVGFLDAITPAIEIIAIIVDIIAVVLILIGAVKFTLRAACRTRPRRPAV